MAIRFYTWPRSSGSRVHWVLEELGVPYERVLLDRGKREHRGTAYLAINPNGKVPALVDGDARLFESLAILLYLAETYGAEKGLWPKSASAGEHAEALSWTVWSLTELQPFMMQFLYHGVDSPVSYEAAQRSKAAADYNGAQLGLLLDVLEKRLTGRDHVMGATFTLVDVAAASTLSFGQMLGVDLGDRPNVRRWLAATEARPARAKVE